MKAVNNGKTKNILVAIIIQYPLKPRPYPGKKPQKMIYEKP